MSSKRTVLNPVTRTGKELNPYDDQILKTVF